MVPCQCVIQKKKGVRIESARKRVGRSPMRIVELSDAG